MKSFTKFLVVVMALGCFAISGRAQDSQQPMTLDDAINGYESVTNGRAGLVSDWSSHHLVFSQPIPDSAAYDRVTKSPRYWVQQIKRGSGTDSVVDDDTAGPYAVAEKKKNQNNKNPKAKLKKDWNTALVADGQVQPNMYPAKFNFYPTEGSCASDFVVYPTGVTPSGAAASIVGYSNLYTTGCTGTVPTVNWAYNTGGMITTSPIIDNDSTGSQIAFIQVTGTAASLVLLKWAPSPATFNFTGSYGADSTTVTVTAGTVTSADVGAQISNTAHTADFPAGDTIASVSGTTITLAAATTNGAARTGQTITIHAETLALPGVPATATNANYRTCTAPCMTTLPLGANDTYSQPYYDFESDDALYVGDDVGLLHQFTGIFNGAAPIADPGSWPVTLNAAAKTTTPVYDPGSGYVFAGNTAAVLYSVGTGNAGTTNATVHGTSSDLGDAIIDGPIVDSSAGKVYVFVTTNTAGNNAVFQFNTGFTAGTGNASATGTAIGTGGTNYWLYSGDFDNVYYSSTNGSAGDLWDMGGSGAAGGDLYRIPIVSSTFVGSTNGTTTVTVTSGTVSATDVGAPISGTDIPAGDYITAFTSPHVTLATAATGTATGTTFTIAGMGAPVVAVSNITDTTTGHFPWSSPITEFCNNGASGCTASATATTTGTDYLFFSVDRLETTTGSCGNGSGDGCILSYSVTTPTAPTLVGEQGVTTVGTPGCWSTSAIIVDNSVGGTLTGASNLYAFELNGNGAGGPTHGTYTSSTCGTEDGETPIAIQEAQTL
jgi:hypothetical protein